MKSSCHFFCIHLAMPTQFSKSNSPVYVLQGTNLYSTNSSIYFHKSPLSVSWHRIYNTLTVNKSSNHTLSLHRPTSNYSSTTNFSISDLRWLTTELRRLLHPFRTDRAQKTQLLHCCEGMLTAPLPNNRSPTVAWLGPHRNTVIFLRVGTYLRSRCLAMGHNIMHKIA
jgi:hypothetical protein